MLLALAVNGKEKEKNTTAVRHKYEESFRKKKKWYWYTHRSVTMCGAGQLGPISDVVQLICHARTRTATFYATVSPCLQPTATSPAALHSSPLAVRMRLF
jgi:hypothetical protein